MIRALAALVLVSVALGGAALGDGRRTSEALLIGLVGMALAMWLWAEEDAG